ncbi:hypothetical protein [Streptomyces nitrosporeus]|uniref:hypothetical protein n=1 Tax=Streptomyces nitrosporeus TaxID=28894 RepID=UPI0039A32F15
MDAEGHVMADERYEWLDADAAESLLRGEWTEPAGAHGLTGARELEAALRALRAPCPPGAGLPGEEAVLAAFREAAAGRAGAARTAGAGHPDSLAHTVRIGVPHQGPARRRPRWSRPLRYGLAVSLAGCALGGVAVAAGTGVLPVPFGDRVSPVPASSVSAAATPEELRAKPPGAPPSARSSGSPDAPAPTADPDPSGPGEDGRESPRDGFGGGVDRERAGDGGRGGGAGGDGPGHSPEPSTGPPGKDPAGVYGKWVQGCRDHRAGRLDGESRRRLAELARGEKNVERFCDHLLGGGGDKGGGKGNGGDGPGGTDEEPQEGGKEALPSLTFRTGEAEDAGGAEDADAAEGEPRPTGSAPSA